MSKILEKLFPDLFNEVNVLCHNSYKPGREYSFLLKLIQNNALKILTIDEIYDLFWWMTCKTDMLLYKIIRMETKGVRKINR